MTRKGSSPYIINFVTYLLLSITCIPLLLSSGLARSDVMFWCYAVIIGFLGALGNGFLIKALECGDLSVLAPINSYKAVVGLLLGMILLKEMPNIYGLAGMFLIILGSFIVLDTGERRLGLHIFQRKDLQYRFLALLFCAAEAIYLKKIILISNISAAYVIWCVFGLIFSVLMLVTKHIDYKGEYAILKTRDASLFINTFLCAGVMQFSTNYVFSHMNVAYALALFQLSSLLSVILGHRYFKEKHIVKKLIGASIMIAGASLIILLK